jgi:hypothetical protein
MLSRVCVGKTVVGVCLAGSVVVLAGQAPAPGPAGAPPPAGQVGQGPARGGPAALPPPSPAAVERAGQVLAATRQALGGEKLAGVKTLIATGRTRRVRGNNLVPIEFEISLEFPDKYLRKDESPFEESDPTTLGFNGEELIQLPLPAAPTAPPAGARAGGPAGAPAGGPPGAAGAPGARAGAPPAAPPAPLTPEQLAAQAAAQRKARVANTIKPDFVRMALGMFPDSFATFPLTFAHAAVAEAPQGKADVIDVRGPNNFTMRLLINSQTRQPIMASWNLPPTNVIVTVPGQPAPATVAPGAVVVTGPAAPAATATEAEKAAYAKEVAAIRAKAQATPIEHRLYYADYRDVDGVQLPFRFRRAIGADTTEETTVDRYRINTKIPVERFRPVK